jgi:hypothetical protein
VTQGISDLLSQALGATSRQGRRPGPTPVVAAAAPAPTDVARFSTGSGPIQKLLAGHEPGIAEWQALARQAASLGEGERATLNGRLAASNASLTLADGGRYVLYRSPDATVAVDLATNRLRRTVGTRVELYEGGKLQATMVAQDGHITVTRGRRVQVWQGATGQGTENGRPLTIPQAAPVPGEAPRAPWTTPPRNHFRLPHHRADQPAAAFVRQVDAAVERAGGRVLQPADAAAPEADWENCFAHALTGGRGDLADPFARTAMPRWLQSPMFQLATHGWSRLAPTQRVHPGDVALYKDGSGAVAHVGIVREVDAAGNPALVESKFGAWGVYLHKPFDVHPAYGVPTDYYRAP